MDTIQRSEMVLWIFVGSLSCAWCFTGCASAYKPFGFGGGYREEQLSDAVYRVSFSGNVYTAPKQVHDYLLRRCAELALQSGYAYFTISDELQHTQSNQTDSDSDNVEPEQQMRDGYTSERTSVGMGPAIVVQPQKLDKRTDSCVMHGYKKGTQPREAIDAAVVFGQAGQREDMSRN
jgi:hypothetical protein